MSKTIDVTSLGEMVIDFTTEAESKQGNPVFEANPGGAPLNVLAMLAKLGRRTSFIGKAGDDAFGRQLKSAMEEAGIGTGGIVFDKKYHTTLAFVHNKADGDREFSFYRNPGADEMLLRDEVKTELIKDSRIFHYGTLSMTNECSKSATIESIKIAKEYGCVLSCDPNLRESLWESLKEAKKATEFAIENCDILKMSDNEIAWFTGENDYDAASAMLREKYNIPLILVSLGTEGSIAYTSKTRAYAKAYKNENTVDTTGAGDTFCACVLHYILEDLRSDDGLVKPFNELIEAWNEEKLEEMLKFANAAASVETTRKGAIRVMPGIGEIKDFLKKREGGE